MKEGKTKDRTLQLLMMLMQAKEPLSREYICKELELSARTLMRYVETYRNAGFIITCRKKAIQLEKKSSLCSQITDLVYFNQEEAAMLYQAINSISGDTEMRQVLKEKLGALYSTVCVKEKLRNLERDDKLQSTILAIEMGCCIKIKNYSSANSHSLKDRVVEPFALGPENKMLWCFEPESMQNKVFLFSRMEDVIVLKKEPWQHRDLHEKQYTDAFRMISRNGETLDVELILNRRAMNLLTDEYPLTINDIQQINDTEWRYKAKVSSYVGIGRFVLGLADNIKVLTPEFRLYLRKFAAMHLSYPDVEKMLHKDVIW